MNHMLFQNGFEVSAYVASLKNYRSVVKSLLTRATPPPEHVSALREKLAEQRSPVRATLMTEDWCGDSAANLPILANLMEAAEVELRVLRGSEHAELKSYYNDRGVTHIPVLSLWDRDWNEIARWVEAPARVDEKKSAWKNGRPEFMRLYHERDADKEAAKQFAVMYREFLEQMVGWYESGDWSETTREVVEAVEPASAIV